MNRRHRRDISIAANELWVRENPIDCEELIAKELKIDIPWLSQALADVLRYGGSPVSLGRLYTAAEKHLGPVITAEAVRMLELQEDDS